MTILTWDDTLSVKIDEIDNQHKKLIELINKLHSAMLSGQGHNIMKNILDELSNYTVYHFETEEKYFNKFNFELSDVHKTEHKIFVSKVTDFKNKYETNSSVLTIEVMNFVKDWVVNHIKGSDQKYVQCFKDNGL
jgi:hemerythrin